MLAFIGQIIFFAVRGRDSLLSSGRVHYAWAIDVAAQVIVEELYTRIFFLAFLRKTGVAVAVLLTSLVTTLTHADWGMLYWWLLYFCIFDVPVACSYRLPFWLGWSSVLHFVFDCNIISATS